MISVIIPLYNKRIAIRKCIQSVINQSFDNWELLIVDDGSTDDSIDEFQDLLIDPRIRYFRKQNGGVSSARNYGVVHAEGEWIVFLDADDYLLADGLKIFYETVQKFGTKICTANFWMEKNNKRIRYSYLEKDKIMTSNFRDLYMRRYILRAGASMFHKTIFHKHMFDEHLSRYEDAQFSLEVMRENIIAYSAQYVMIYSEDNLGLSRNLSEPNKDFIFNMIFENKTFWERIQLASLLNLGLKLYKYNTDLLKKKYKHWLFYSKIEFILSYYKRLIVKLRVRT